jgi:hypothetical protein
MEIVNMWTDQDSGRLCRRPWSLALQRAKPELTEDGLAEVKIYRIVYNERSDNKVDDFSSFFGSILQQLAHFHLFTSSSGT